MCSEALRRSLLPFCLALLVGCGKMGDPQPPLRDVPLRTTDLKVRQLGQEILLDMAYPSTTLGGFALGGIDAVELMELVRPALPPEEPEEEEAEDDASAEEEAEASAEEEAEKDGESERDEDAAKKDVPSGPRPPAMQDAEFGSASRVLLTLRGTDLAAAVSGNRLQIRLPLELPVPDPPVAQFYAVRTYKGEEASAYSNRVVIIPRVPPQPPSNLRASAQADGVELSWDSALEEAEGFDVYRREAQIRGYDEPLRRVGGDKRSFLDRSAAFGQRYIYTVRTVAATRPAVASNPAGEQEIQYEDRFAPPLPGNFVALGERSRVRLRWDASNADDVAGYVIYRREPGRDFHALNSTPITELEYLDPNLVTGYTYGYRIQVVDQAGNESALSPPVDATVR